MANTYTIKPLEWSRSGRLHEYRAETLFGQYIANNNQWFFSKNYRTENRGAEKGWKKNQAAAQAHFEEMLKTYLEKIDGIR